jgi:hypothetical protein
MMTAFGCTRLPASQETGVKPGEYDGMVDSETLISENESLKEELTSTEEELKTTKEDYLNLAKNNDIAIEKLNELESMIDILQNENMPEFTLEDSDASGIENYLNEKKAVLDNVYRKIEVIPMSTRDDSILFYTTGYGEEFNQIFIWDVGNDKPEMVSGANFSKKGNFSWLLQDEYLIIDTGNDGEKKILSVDENKIMNTFMTNSEIYLLPGTSSILMKKSKTESTFVVYDFVDGLENEVDLDYKNKYTDFQVDEENNNIIFTGTYIGENDVQYSINAKMNIDKIKDLNKKSDGDEVEKSETEDDSAEEEKIEE